MERPTTNSESNSEREVFVRQAQAVERLADYFVPAQERKRFARLVRAISWIGARLFIVVGLLVGGSEAVQWLYQTWEIRNTAKDYAEVGSEIFYKENNPQVAKSLLDEAIALNPDNSRYRFFEAYIDGMGTVRNLLNLDRPYTKEELDQTHQALGKALFLERQSPEKPEAQILRGQIYAVLEDYDRARQSLLEAIDKAERLKKEEPNFFEKSIIDASVYLGDLTGLPKFKSFIMTTFNVEESAEDMDSHLSFAHVRLALVENQVGSADKAISYLDKALEYDPESKWAYLWQGVFASERKHWLDARAFYDLALQKDSRFDLAYYNKGWTFLRSKPKDYNSARDMFQTAISLNPDYKEAYYGLGMVYGYQNKYQVAHEYLSRAIEIDNMFLNGWKWRAIVNDELGEFDAALKDFSQAIGLDPSNDDLYVRRARVLTKQGEYEAALHDLLLAKDFNSNNYRIPYYTGRVYAALDQYENAAAEFGRAIELRKGYSEAYAARASVWHRAGNLIEARHDYDSAVQNASYRPERMLVKRAEYFMVEGNLELALADYRLARESNPRYSTAWLGEAQAAMELKDNSSALVAINEYLKLKPQSEKAIEMKKVLSGD